MSIVVDADLVVPELDEPPTAEEVRRAIAKLKCRKSSGRDGVVAEFLQFGGAPGPSAGGDPPDLLARLGGPCRLPQRMAGLGDYRLVEGRQSGGPSALAICSCFDFRLICCPSFDFSNCELIC